MIRSLLLTIFLPCIGSIAYAQGNKADYYNIPQPIVFNEKQYLLSDAYHPKPAYYKQEYIQAGESADKFTSMIIIDVLITDLSPKELATAKAAELEEAKKSNPVINYMAMSMEGTDEYMLNFLISASEGDKVSVVERNIYRYAGFLDPSGRKGVMLFGFAQRAYSDDVTAFLKNQKEDPIAFYEKIEWISTYQLPKIQLIE